MDRVRAVLPAPDAMGPRVGLLVAGIVVFAVGSAVLIRARLGPGVRDGLMTGACARWGWPVGMVRTGLEVSVLGLGLVVAGGPANAIGAGSLGVGTLVVAASLGPLMHLLLPRRHKPTAVPEPPSPAPTAGRT
jgi:uncharacterized membrane protein YczE